MGASRVATAVTMNAEDVKFGVKTATDSLKKLVTISKQSDAALQSLKFFKKLELGLKAITFGFNALRTGFDKLMRGLNNPIQQIPFIDSFAVFVDETLKGTLQQYNLGVAINANINEMQALALAAADVGLEMNQLYEPISKLPRKLQEAATGRSLDMVKTFQEMGVDAMALRNLGASEGTFAQLKEVANALNAVEDMNQRLYFFNKIFEESGPKFRQFFALGAEGIEELEQKVKDLGLTVEDVEIATLKALNIELAETQKVWRSLSRDILIDISPGLIGFLKTLKDYMTTPAFRIKLVGEFTALFLDITSALMAFTDSFIALAKIVGDLRDSIMIFAPSAKSKDGRQRTEFEMLMAKKLYELLEATKGLNEYQQKQLDDVNAFFAKEGNWKEDKVGGILPSMNEFGENFRKNMEAIQALIDEQLKRMLGLEGNGKVGDFGAAVDKFIEKITYSAASNAASATPGKLTGGLDAREGGGIEMMFKYLEPGYGEDKEVTLLKKIEKVLKRIEGQGKAGNAGIEGAM
jgi:hypothetical protein